MVSTKFGILCGNRIAVRIPEYPAPMQTALIGRGVSMAEHAGLVCWPPMMNTLKKQ